MAESRTVRHLERVDWSPDPFSAPDLDQWPFTIPAVAELIRNEGLEIPPGVTFLIGENGTGKSTIIEALASTYPRTGFESPFTHRRFAEIGVYFMDEPEAGKSVV